MEEKENPGLEMVRSYSMKYYGRIPEAYELLGRYLPDPMIKWIEFRKSVFQDPPIGALSLKEKELICMTIEIANLKPNCETHAKLAIRAGASVKEIAEVAAICILLGGMATHVAAGQNAIKAAEQEYEKMMKEKEGHQTFL
jgi:alkylhydroperoxidase/carboxymuconolactone decarboxylase family protein YurZ